MTVDANGIHKKLEHRSPSFGSITLGFPHTPDGNNEATKVYLRDKAEKWEDKVRSEHIPKHEAWLCMNTTIIKSLV